MCAIDQQPSKVAIASFADSTKAGLAARRILPRYETQPSGKLPAAAKLAGLHYGCRHGGGDDWSNTRNGGQTLTHRIALVPGHDLRLDRRNTCLKLINLFGNHP